MEDRGGTRLPGDTYYLRKYAETLHRNAHLANLSSGTETFIRNRLILLFHYPLFRE